MQPKAKTVGVPLDPKVVLSLARLFRGDLSDVGQVADACNNIDARARASLADACNNIDARGLGAVADACNNIDARGARALADACNNLDATGLRTVADACNNVDVRELSASLKELKPRLGDVAKSFEAAAKKT